MHKPQSSSVKLLMLPWRQGIRRRNPVRPMPVLSVFFFTHASDILFAQAYEIYSTASFTLLFQNWFEAITLVIIVAVFIVITPMSAIILRKAYAIPLHMVHIVTYN
jgi:hypothetical protein